jgi:hypothetical protein
MSLVLRTSAVVAATALLAACGGGASAKKAPTASEGKSAASAINLKAADVPGYKGAAHDKSNAGGSDDVAFAACVGASKPHADEIADTFSEDFSKGEGTMISQVSSEVSVVSKTDTASKDVKAYKSDKAKSCLDTFVTKLLTKNLGGSGATFGKPSVKALDVKTAGIDDSFGYEITIEASAAGQSFPLTISLLAMLKDHTEVSLTTLTVGASLTASDRDRYADILRGRLKDSAV